MRKVLPVRWDINAFESLEAIYDYLKKDSETAANDVREVILNQTSKLGGFPEMFAIELLLSDLPGNFRSVTKWNYKIIYEVTEKEVIIIDIFHTSQHPEKIKRPR